jgi:uncharacterized C2H2 Zn-finger protein
MIEEKQEETDVDLEKVILKTVEDVCGTSDKFIYKCDKCKNVFRIKGNLIAHQKTICTGLKSEYPLKKKRIVRPGLAKDVVKCPDCGEVFKSKGKDKADYKKIYFFYIKDLSLIILRKYSKKCTIKYLF